MKYYVHGAGRAGRQAWPDVNAQGAVFADHSAQKAMPDKAAAVAEQAPRQPSILVAHSLGAVAAADALQRHGMRASHLILLEPALYDVARTDAAIRRHVAAMTEARERAASGDLFGYWEIVSPMMFKRPAAIERWDEDRPLAERFSEQEPPWGHDIAADELVSIPTLVITGNWNNEYEAIAARLAHAGAEHVHMGGFNHRPQDHPDFNSAVEVFVR